MTNYTVLTLILFWIGTMITYGQVDDKKITNEATEGVISRVDIPPQFPGGFQELYKYINKNLVYPKDARKDGIEGTVFVEFVIDSTGVIDPATINVLKGLYKSCDDEAMRLIAASPKWTPGRITTLNRNVKVKMTLPIKFKK